MNRLCKALKLKMTSVKGKKEIDSFAHVLSEMQTSLKLWVSKFQQAHSIACKGSENQLEQPLADKTAPALNGRTSNVVDSPDQNNLDSLVSPSPLVSWRVDYSTESSRQLFSLTPLPRPKGFSSRLQGSYISVPENIILNAFHHKLLSPIKSAGCLPSKNAAHIKEAAAYCGKERKSNCFSADYWGKKVLLNSDSTNSTRLSSLRYNVIRGNVLSVLLEQKIRELTHGFESAHYQARTAGRAASILAPSFKGLATTLMIYDQSSIEGMLADKLPDFSTTDPSGLITKYKLQVMGVVLNHLWESHFTPQKIVRA
ncbi:hypothetical protein F0562_026294 [Nyssa sinensis]|uniref:Uncharacterized protein n=1 Tax=Nyssa sinensis TaxID=561372 RepID=A0A5J5BCH6_9ASTE|nr:hypothetical protein F0562_026294 [Nyssa sinensis]